MSENRPIGEMAEWVFINDLTDSELLVQIMEEAGEVVQAASKAQRFGHSLCHPNTRISNVQDLCAEFAQLYHLVMEYGNRHGWAESEIVGFPKNKIARLKELSCK